MLAYLEAFPDSLQLLLGDFGVSADHVCRLLCIEWVCHAAHYKHVELNQSASFFLLPLWPFQVCLPSHGCRGDTINHRRHHWRTGARRPSNHSRPRVEHVCTAAPAGRSRQADIVTTTTTTTTHRREAALVNVAGWAALWWRLIFFHHLNASNRSKENSINQDYLCAHFTTVTKDCTHLTDRTSIKYNYNDQSSVNQVQRIRINDLIWSYSLSVQSYGWRSLLRHDTPLHCIYCTLKNYQLTSLFPVSLVKQVIWAKLMRRAKAYSSSCSQVIVVYLHPFRRNSLFCSQKSPKNRLKSIFLGFKVVQGHRCW